MNKIYRILFVFATLLVANASWAGNGKIIAINIMVGTTSTPSAGTVKVYVDNAEITNPATTEIISGKVVTLEVTPANGYYFTSLTANPFPDAGSASAPRRAVVPELLGALSLKKTGDNTYTFSMPSADVEITAVFAACTDISTGYTINLANSSYTYDWQSHSPVVNSVTKDGTSTKLKKGEDYTLLYRMSNNNGANWSGWDEEIPTITDVKEKIEVKATGIGIYTGNITVPFTITPRDIASATIFLSENSYDYTGGEQKPVITGVYLLGKSLTEYHVTSNPDGQYTGPTYSGSNGAENFIKPGTYDVTISGRWTSTDPQNFQGTCTKTYTIEKKDISQCKFEGSTSLTFNNAVQAPSLTVKNGSLTVGASNYDITYSVHATSDEATNASKDIGNYVMTFTAKGDYYKGSIDIPYSINSAGNITITLTEREYKYNGSAIVPADADIVIKDGATTLVKGTHYDVVCYNNINAGWATVTAVGKGQYGFSVSANYQIKPRDLTAGMVTLSSNSFVYNAQVQKPTVTVKDYGDDPTTHQPITSVTDDTPLIIKSSDYVITNEGGTNVGNTYEVKVKGQNNYTGTITKTFSITQETLTGASVTLSSERLVYNRTTPAQPDVLLVKSVNGVVAGTSEYTKTYSNSGSSNTAGNHTVRVEATKEANIYTGNFEDYVVVDFTVDPKPISDLTITLSETSFTYNGNVQKPVVTVTDGSALTENTDYTLEYDGAATAASSAVGSYTITIKGKGNYSGEINKTYVINYGTSDSDFIVTVSGTYTYSGSAFTPAGSNIDVTDGSQAVIVKKKKGTDPETYTILTPGTDYNLSYHDNINAGKATVTATGTGNYQFVQTGKFTIQPKAITDGMAILSGTDFVTSNQSFVYNAALQKPNVTITDDVTSTTLVEGTDYTLVNDGGTSVASYNVTITGIGNYTTGTTGLVKNYSITALSLSGASVTLDPLQSYVYDGKEKRPGVQQVKVGNVVVPATDYEFSYPRDAAPTDDDLLNVNAGNNTAVVYIKPATGNLLGTASANFSISPKPLTNSMVALQSASGSYTGSPHTVSVTVTDNGLPEGDPGWNIVPATNYDVVPPTDMTNPGVKDIEVVGKNNYSGTITKTYTILPAGGEDYTVTIGGTYTYDGTAKTPHDADANHTNNITVTKGTGDGATTLTLDTDYTVSYRNNINAGNNSAIAIVTGKGKYSFTVEKAFTIDQRTMNQDDIVITLSDNSFTYNGNEQKPNVSVKDGNIPLHVGIDYEITYPTSEYIGQGTKTININGIGNYKDTKAATYTINKLSLETAVITLPATRFEYSRGEQKPTPVVSVSNFVIPSANYDVRWDNDADATNTADVTNIGTKTVYVTGKSNCDGSKSTDYNIVAKQIDASMVTLTNSVMTYTGSPLDPGVVVKDGAATLIKGTDTAPQEYKVELTNNTKVGTATVTVEGQGNYTGKVQKTFVIKEKESGDFTIAAIAAVTYNGSEYKPTPAVYYGTSTTPLTINTDYTLSYINNVNAGTATVTVTGKGGYEGSTGTKTFTINPKTLISDMVTLSNFTVTDSDPKGFTYNGNNQKPNVTITDAAAPIIADDYDITNAGGVDANDTNNPTYSVTITGKRNYTGTVNLTYKIYQRDISSASVTLNQMASYIYDGSNKIPGVSQVAFGSEVVATTEYDVTYDNNRNAGTATVTVTGKKNYTGTTTATFTIQKKAMTDNMITFNQDSFDYDGSNHAPTVTMVDLVGSTNIVNTDQTQDFTITIPTVSAVGSYTVNVEATTTGNYSGSGSKQFSIVPKGSVAFDVAWVTEPDFTYDGMPHTPAVKVTKHNTTTELTAADYDIEYNNNINAGTNTASVTVTGRGNYSGSQTKTFSIAQKAMTDGMVALSGIPVETDGTYFTYDGTLKKPVVTVSDGTPSIITADDYTISNEGNINAGDYTVTVTASATGNYSGSGSQTYTIYPMSITAAEVALSYNNIVYNGVAQKPTVRSVYANGHLLTATTDYTITLPADADAINQGAKNVTVTGTGNYKDSRTVQYTIDKKPLVSDMIKIANQNLTYTGSDQTPEVTIEDKNGTTNIIKSTDYTLSNPPHSTVGDYEVTLTATAEGNYRGQVTKQYSIVGAGATGFTVMAIPDQNYTGIALTPALTVYKAGTTTPALTLGTDYTAEYSNNINAGTATVTVTGKGNYSGTQTVYFTIVPKSINHTDISVTLSPTSFNYTGTTQKPSVTVKDGTSKTLVLNTDYTLVNDGGVANGTYTVTITGMGNYKDVITPAPSYTIGGQSLNGAEVILNRLDSYVYDGNEKKPGVSEVKVGSTVIPASNYTVSYADNVNAGTATVTVTGKGNCSGTATATFPITPKTVNSDMITISPTTFNYDGQLHKPTTVTVKDGTRDMVEDTDYTLSNPGGTDIGSYGVTITGKGNYTGTASKSFSIVANDASGFSINAIADVTYNGAAQEPVPMVKEGDNTLSSNYYSVAYLNNINAGTAVVTVTGKNGYSFVKSQTFKIKPKALSNDMLTLSASSFMYNGNVQKPTPTMDDKNAGVSIITSNDYVVTNEGGVDVGTYHVVITGQNNYTGAIDKTFTITQLSMSTATITLATLSSYVYDGLAKTPAVQLVKVGELVVPATAYDVAYSSNTNVGTATVTVTAKTGTNFKDGNTTTFSIEQKPVTSDMIYLSSENLEYTGSNIKPEVTVKDGTKTLALTTDYTLTNAGGTEVGSYEVMITGQGNYKGTAKKQYSIITKGAAGFTVDELTVPLTYTGMPLTPTVTVKKAGTTTILTLGTDYEVAYADNINVGTATATVTGKGNYSGTRSVNFIINPKPLTDGMVALSSTSFTYNGSEQKPVVSVTDTDNNMPLTQNTDYTVTYPTDAISQGTKTVTIRGIGNYTGEITKDYTIGLLSLNDASVTLNELTSYIYDGNEKRPTVREVLVGTLVIPTTGYTVAYPDDVINIGTKTMTITGKGNYTGSTTASYTITPKTVNKEMILLSNENLIYTGSIIKPTVTVKDGSKTLIENTDYTLTNDGGKEVGTYSLTITGKGNYTGTASRTFNIITKGASVFSVSDIASVIYNGSEQEPDITVMDNSTTPATVLTKGTHYTVAYSNNKNVGSASVIVTGIGSYAGTVSKNFTIMPKTLTGAMVILSTTSFVFNSLAQKPEVTVEDKNAANVSIITDYDYTILNNGGINVGDDHEVKVTGKGNYTGTVTKTYAITPLSIADANVTLYQLQSYVYDGTAKKPGVREVMVGDITVPTTGYDVSYGENTNVGTATVTLTGKGNFKDAKTVNFTITGKPITSDMIVLSSENFIYNGEVQKPTVVVKDGAKTLTLGTDYALTNAGGTSVGTYSVTVAGMGNYASEASRSYSIVEKDGTTNFTISLSNTSVQYNGSAQTPAVTVTDGVKTLSNNTDYEVAYTNHVNVGTATVTVMGKGNYAGTKMATFTITAKPLTETMVTLSETSFVYNTLIQKPEVSVSDGDIMTKDDYVITNNGGTNQGTYHVIVNGQGNYSGQIDKTFTITPLSIVDANVTLYQLQSYVYEGLQKKPGVREVTVGNINVPTQGYTTSYGDNVNAGTASVTVTGQGNFKDSKTVTFEIEPKAVENSMITLSNYEYTYNGEIQKPEVIVRDGETTLVLDTDYTLQNNGGKTVGAYDVTITGKGNYKGTASKTYIINAKEVGSFEVTLSAESVIYNGSEQQPEVTVKDGETVLTPGVNYTVAYTDNVNVGMATVTVRGLGEYDGSRDKTFLIKPKELSNAMVSLSSTTFTYNGLLQMPAVTVSDGTALTSNDYYITNEGGLDKGTYNVMVTGRNNYTGTVVRQYAINPMSINDAHVTLYQLQSYVYDGTEKNPGVREVAVGSHIVPSTSFTTTISPNINVGTVTVTVTGEKNYTGSASTTFEITPKPVTSGMITLTPDYFYYNGSVQKPAVIVKDGSKNMVENTDYTVTNEGGMEAGDYEVKVKGIGNYMDEASVKFTILSSGVNTFVVTLETTEYTFDGTERKPNVTVKMEDRTLSEGTDYTLLYNNNVNAGTATVTVKGVGDYTGEQVKTFVILPKTLTGEMVTLDKTSFIYNEKVQKPEVTVADGTHMTEDDYTVTNEGGTDEGTYQVVVVGQNNYKGTVIKSFTITREEIHGDDDPEHPDEKTVTYTPTEEGSDEVKVSGCEGTETELKQVTSVTVPATFTSNGKTYTVVGISANAFANVPNLTDVYLPDTEEPLEIAEDAIPATATIHTTLALLDDYALMPSLSESFKAGKIMTTVTAKNRYWTFSSGVDVYVPDGVSVYIARERDNATVTIVELSDNDLTVGGQRIIKHNNGVLISSEGNDTPYDLVACGRRMTSGTTISTDDYKDYGSQNCLVPVIVATHFGTGYYFMKNNEFYSIQEESEDIKVPAGKAVLYLRQAASSPSYSSIIQLVNTGEVTNINSITDDTDEGDWYDMSGRKLNGRPTKRGVYIKNNKKTVIR